MGRPARTTPAAVQSTPLYGTLSESEGEKVAIRDALNEELKHEDIAPGLLAEWDRQDAPVWEDEENHSLELDSASSMFPEISAFSHRRIASSRSLNADVSGLIEDFEIKDLNKGPEAKIIHCAGRDEMIGRLPEELAG